MILNEITNLPSITNVSNENENLREVNLVQLNENSALLLIVTNLGNIYKNYLYIEKDSEINDIKTILNDFCDKEIVIVTSIINELNFLDEYENKKIINLNCPLENDLLIEAVKKLKEKKRSK